VNSAIRLNRQLTLKLTVRGLKVPAMIVWVNCPVLFTARWSYVDSRHESGPQLALGTSTQLDIAPAAGRQNLTNPEVAFTAQSSPVGGDILP
jgi:hypothetical protein